MSWINKNQSNQTFDRYPVLKMAARSCLPRSEYLNALNFWKSLERKYYERRRRYMSEREKQQEEQGNTLRVNRYRGEAHVTFDTDEDASTHTDDGSYADAEDEEFSDVDPEFFVDPGAQYYSGLNKDGWEKITSALERLNSQKEAQIARSNRGIIRGLVFAGLLIATLIITGLSLIWKTQTEQPEEVMCQYHCNTDGPSLTEELFRAVFPAGSIDDEI